MRTKKFLMKRENQDSSKLRQHRTFRTQDLQIWRKMRFLKNSLLSSLIANVRVCRTSVLMSTEIDLVLFLALLVPPHYKGRAPQSIVSTRSHLRWLESPKLRPQWRKLPPKWSRNLWVAYLNCDKISLRWIQIRTIRVGCEVLPIRPK